MSVYTVIICVDTASLLDPVSNYSLPPSDQSMTAMRGAHQPFIIWTRIHARNPLIHI